MHYCKTITRHQLARREKFTGYPKLPDGATYVWTDTTQLYSNTVAYVLRSAVQKAASPEGRPVGRTSARSFAPIDMRVRVRLSRELSFLPIESKQRSRIGRYGGLRELPSPSMALREAARHTKERKHSYHLRRGPT